MEPAVKTLGGEDGAAAEAAPEEEDGEAAASLQGRPGLLAA